MKILFLNSMKADEFGGGEKWMIAAATGLQKKGHHVVLAGKENSLFIKKARETDIPTVHIDIKRDFSPITTWKIEHFLQQYKIDIVICNFNKDLRVGGLAARFAGTPLVLARHGLILCPKKWKYKITLKYLADGIITNSQAIKDIYLSYGWFDESFIKVIYNGVEIKSKPVSNTSTHTIPGKHLILAAGRLTTQKGFFYLIKAMVFLKRIRNDFHLLIAGDGDQYQQLAVQIRATDVSDAVTLIGHIEDITPYLRECDLVVLSSLYEGMPNIVLEAMAAGKAVVATDVHGVREVVQHEKTGLLVPPKNSDALMKAIHHLLDNPQEREMYGKAGKKRVKENFSMNAMIDHLEQYLIEEYTKKIRS